MLKNPSHKIAKKALFWLQFYSILQWKYKSYQSLVKKYDIFAL